MKLYNLFNDIILEELHKTQNLLTEGVAESVVLDAINGMYNVKFKYKDIENNVTDRYVQVYCMGSTKAGNAAIRGYQISGGSKRGNNSGWKIFLLNNIAIWEKTNMKWYNPVSDYDANIEAFNQTGDNSFIGTITCVDSSKFGRQRSDISQNPNPKPQVQNNNELNK